MSSAVGQVSVLVVAYRHEAYIEEAIRSALEQTYPVHEVIVVDDGSPDRTADRARSIGDPRIRVLEESHRGLSALAGVYNAGLRACTGQIVALLEGDDRWPRDKLARQAPIFSDLDIVLSHGLYSVIGASGAVLHPGVRPPLDLPHGRYDARPYMLRASYVMTVTAVVNRDALQRVGGFRQLPGTSHCDYTTFLRLAEQGPFHFQAASVGEWRRHSAAGTYRLIEATGARAAMQAALAARASSTDPALPTPQEIRRSWADADARRVWQNVRVLLIERRHAEARHAVLAVLFKPASLGLRLRLSVALMAACFGRDVEWLARRLGHASLFADL